jgi:hypothetical protein
MRLLRLPPSPKSRRLLLVLIGTGCPAALAASVMGNLSPYASPSKSGAYVPAQARGVSVDRRLRADVVPDNP